MSQSPSVRGPLDHAAARRLIDAFLVDDLLAQDAARLAAHVKECPACAAEIGGTTRLLALLGSLPTPPPAPDLDERIYAAAIADRARRHDHRSWLANLRTQVLRGAVRTTGTLMVAIVTVAFLGGAFVLAAAFFTQPAPAPTPHATVAPDMTPTPAPTKVESTAPAETPPAVVATPVPTAKPVVTPEPTPVPSPSPSPSASLAGTERDPRAVAQRDRGTVAHPLAVSNPVADGEATADSTAVGRPVTDPNPGAVRSAVPNIAVTARRAGPATPFRALRKAMEQTRAGSVDTTKGAPGPTRTREPTAPVHAPDYQSPMGGIHLNLMKKAISLGTSAALVASLLATVVAPAAVASTTTGSVGTFLPAARSTATGFVHVHRERAGCFPAGAASSSSRSRTTQTSSTRGFIGAV